VIIIKKTEVSALIAPSSPRTVLAEEVYFSTTFKKAFFYYLRIRLQINSQNSLKEHQNRLKHQIIKHHQSQFKSDRI
jgi:hypothetical protein